MGLKYAAIMLAAGISIIPWIDSDAKKIRQSLKIEKEKKPTSEKGNGKTVRTGSIEDSFEGIRIDAVESVGVETPENGKIVFYPDQVSFSGYDKQATSTIESFLLTNKSGYDISGIKVRIYYKDMKGRMLHSRDVSKKCNVRSGETQKLDVSTWDKQKSYYYYLSNEPRRVSTPYQVDIQPLAFWILLSEE